jgi:hypothetical protein
MRLAGTHLLLRSFEVIDNKREHVRGGILSKDTINMPVAGNLMAAVKLRR